MRLPMGLDQAVTEAAKAAGVPKSTWVRQAIEVALATQKVALPQAKERPAPGDRGDVRTFERDDCSTLCDARREPVHG